MTFFGPDLRNGLPIGLGSVAGFGIAPQFSPASLFLGGTVQGAWYDPSDATTLFSDRAGTTPCGTPGGGSVVPVGLMLDKSQGLVLGSELVTNGGPGFTATTGWTAEGTNTVAVVGGELEVTLNSALFSGIAGTNLTTVAGQWYRIVVTARRGTTASNFILRVDSASNDITFTSTNSTTVNYYFRASGTSAGIRFLTAASGGTGTFYVTSVSVRALAGNHAIAANDTTARPELRARVNLLTYSEDFSNAVWLVFGGASKISANAIRVTTAGTGSNVYQQFTAAETSANSYVFSVEVMRNAGSNQTFQLFSNLRGTQQSSGDLTATDTWQRFTITGTYSSGATGSVFGIIGNTAGMQADLLVRNADLRPTNIGTAMPAYQRISDVNTYDAVGFPRYLAFNGTSSAMSTPGNVNLSGTDKATVFAGVRKPSDVVDGMVTELSSAISSNNGAFLMAFPGNIGTGSAANMVLGLSGTAASYSNASPYVAPTTNVLQASFDISKTGVANEINQRVNGLAPTTIVYLGSDCGTGNFGSYPLFIGSRGNSSLFFNGNIYSLIVVGSAVSASQISATEQWVAQRIGIVI